MVVFQCSPAGRTSNDLSMPKFSVSTASTSVGSGPADAAGGGGSSRLAQAPAALPISNFFLAACCSASALSRSCSARSAAAAAAAAATSPPPFRAENQSSTWSRMASTATSAMRGASGSLTTTRCTAPHPTRDGEARGGAGDHPGSAALLPLPCSAVSRGAAASWEARRRRSNQSNSWSLCRSATSTMGGGWATDTTTLWLSCADAGGATDVCEARRRSNQSISCSLAGSWDDEAKAEAGAGSRAGDAATAMLAL
mmetsp:Transcript_10377/g.26602  ORF Transcript_10377/g.26602 Transcript_10377/m.26602 type:complete len:255 (+) Transcript_10377:849-1613(+)